MGLAGNRTLGLAVVAALLAADAAMAQEGYAESLGMVGETGQSTRGRAAATPAIRNFVSGEVALDNGTPPPTGTLVTGYCDGRRVFGGHTDSKGRFSIRMEPNAAAGTAPLLTPSWAQQGTFDDFRGRSSDCEVKASLAGHRSTSATLQTRAGMGAPRVGVIILERADNVEGLTISATSLKAPKQARKAFERGTKEAGKQRWSRAQTAFEQAVALYPEYAVAWFELGEVHQQQSRAVEARAAYAKSIACDAKYVSPYLQIAAMDTGLQNWQAVDSTTERILRLNPYDFPEAYFYSALANLWLGNLAVATQRARLAIRSASGESHHRARLVLGLALAQQGHLAEAEARLREYLETDPDVADGAQIRAEVARIAALRAKE